MRLSGGEAQRIALARAVLMRPLLFVLNEAIVMSSLQELKAKMTIVMVSHKESLYMKADQLIELE